MKLAIVLVYILFIVMNMALFVEPTRYRVTGYLLAVLTSLGIGFCMGVLHANE